MLIITLLLLWNHVNSCGVQLWASREGYKQEHYDSLGYKDVLDSAKYKQDVSCLCEARCQSSPDCHRWAAEVRYLAKTTIVREKCLDKSKGRGECGFNATCFLKNTNTDEYQGQISPMVTDGYFSLVGGVRRCTRPAQLCAGRHCCNSNEVCHTEMGCLAVDGVKEITKSPYKSLWFWVPLIIACALAACALVVRLWGLVLVLAKKPRSPFENDIIHFLLELASLTFVFTEFVLMYWVLTNVKPDDYRAVTSHRLRDDVFTASTEINGRGFDTFVRKDILTGNRFPMVVKHMGETYLLSGDVKEPVWQVWFQWLMFLFNPVQLLFHLLMATHKIWLGYMYARGMKLLPEVHAYRIFIDIIGPLENAYILEPVHRAWFPEMFASWGMSTVFIVIMFIFFFFQVAFIASIAYQAKKQNFDFLTCQRIMVSEQISINSILMFSFPLWFGVVAILAFIYKGTTPSGPASIRVWYFYLGAIICHIIKFLLSLFDHHDPIPEEEKERIEPKELGNIGSDAGTLDRKFDSVGL